MNKIKILLSGLGIATVLVAIQSCTKELEYDLPIDKDFSNKSRVQVYNAMVGSLRNYVYVDGNRLNGVTMAYGAAFPGTTFSALTPGLLAFQVKDTLRTSTQVPLNFAENFQADTYYSVFMYDTITSPKQITVPTNIVIPADTTARLRLANFVFSRTAVPAIDVFSVKRNANIFTNVAVTQVTEFIPFASVLSDTLIVRETGTTNVLAQFNGLNIGRKRSYTAIFRGRYQTPSTGTNGRTLAVFANR